MSMPRSSVPSQWAALGASSEAPLGWVGRHSLLLYLLHQPVIYGVLTAASLLW